MILVILFLILLHTLYPLIPSFCRTYALNLLTSLRASMWWCDGGGAAADGSRKTWWIGKPMPGHIKTLGANVNTSYTVNVISFQVSISSPASRAKATLACSCASQAIWGLGTAWHDDIWLPPQSSWPWRAGTRTPKWRCNEKSCLSQWV